MITDGEGLASGTNLQADVCILGAGAAGITLARALSGNGLQVVVLESGAESLEPEIQDLAAGESVGEPLGFSDNPATLDSIRLRQLGGTTNHWAGFCRPFDEVDFEVRPQLERSGWPITRAELDPWYQAAHEVLGLGPYRFDWEYWVEEQGRGAPLIDTPLVRTAVYQIHDLRFGPAFRDELAALDDVDVVLRTNAVDVRTTGDVVDEVRAKTLGGVELRVTGMRAVVVALGGIENARLLLACNTQRPAGLGNEQDLVGRYFCEHFAVPAAIAVAGTDPDELSALFEADVGAEEGTLRIKGELALTSEAVRDRGLLSLNCQVVVGAYAEERPRVISGLGISEVAAVAQATGAEPPRSSLYLLATAEQELNPESRVRLGSETDPLGMPRVELDWQFTERDRSSILEGMAIIGEELGRTGVGRLQVTPGTIRFERTDGIRPYVGGLAIDADAADPTGFELGLGFHHMCTTRMAADPADGVVDADLRVHTVDNLFVAGSSSFGTAGASTPTYTLVALTLRLADHLLNEVLA